MQTLAPCFRLLGLLQVNSVRVTARRQQVVLAMLLLNANRVVPLESLLDALWGSTPPATARAQIQTSISALRRLFVTAGVGERIRVRGLGYTIELAPAELDLHVFEDLVSRGRAELAACRPDAAREAFRSALALWRGEPLTGVDSTMVRANQVRIAERRVEAFEDCFDAELQLGLHHEIVGEISTMVEEFPLRERFVGQLMTALHRCGRRVEALTAYRTVRQTFVDELGLEPGEELRRLHQDILNGHAEPVSKPVAASVSVPRMLPARVPYFTGNGAALAGIQAQLTDDHGPLVAVITGRGGVGKSAVAIEAAHRLAAQFPDGQLYARMTENIADVLERFLLALGFTAIPADVEGRAALYRSAIADRRVLTIVEDATDLAQIRSLVPGTASSRLVMTTRARTAPLPGSTVFELDVLGGQGGIALLAAMVGRDRVWAELAEANELVELCGGLQLALSGAASMLAARPHWTFGHLVARFRNGLDPQVRASLQRSFAGLSPASRTLFARLGSLDTVSFASWVAAPLLDLDAVTAADALEGLVDARLVDVVGAGIATRYRLHRLARIHARELLAAQDNDGYLARLFGAWLALTDEARLRQGFGTRGDASRWPLADSVVNAVLTDPAGWYAQERVALLAMVRHAAAIDAVEHCWNLAVAIADLAGAQRMFGDWRDSNECALRAALRAGDRLGEAATQYLLGELDLREHRYGEASARISLALGMFDRLGEIGWQELAERSLAVVDWATTPRQALAG
ncbi:AfsR/SARP family transcriptional regulator [Kutzneria kofuensis]|uniref:DNA-binding SARP family transcriptional activator n=1 Tax=Kutzneria kofuensis TaxID=103725 RepID=A0A7W9KNI8_9PSEU|nr:AfsR/SARP family transcriptional regulator [Kutzneria kofuensis]MBB5895828.1 DNA-binding SARP family transcriptional activator [Kutzneria kofuensis]